MTLISTNTLPFVINKLHSTLHTSYHLYLPDNGCSFQPKHVEPIKPTVQLAGEWFVYIGHLHRKCNISNTDQFFTNTAAKHISHSEDIHRHVITNFFTLSMPEKCAVSLKKSIIQPLIFNKLCLLPVNTMW
jgi:hypothetical protein